MNQLVVKGIVAAAGVVTGVAGTLLSKKVIKREPKTAPVTATVTE